MGSVGVQSGSGAITRSEVSQLKGDINSIRSGFSSANSLVVYPNNYSTSQTIRESAEKWAERLGLGTASRGYAVAMTGATAGQKKAFASALNSALNLRQNSESAYQSRTDRLIARAEAWAKANGRSGLTAIERRAINEIARSSYQRTAVDRIIQKDRNNGNKLFGGNIRTRNLRKSDF